MSEIERREFLRLWAFAAGLVALPGCGGGGDGASQPVQGGTPAPESSPPTTPAPVTPTPTPASGPVAPPPPAGPVGSLQFVLMSASTQDLAPFTLGIAFKQGDIPNGSGVGANLAALQVVPKNRWPDGSLKFAIVSGLAPLLAGTPRTVSLTVAATSVTVPLTLAQLKASGIVAVVDAGAYGSASWAGADWDAPFMAWVAGPQMSSWIYRKPVGADPHLVAWLEVRCYASGAVEVLPWMENGYLRVATPTSKSATYGFILGGRQRFSRLIDLPHHCRTPLVDGTILSHWLGNDPAVGARQDVDYLQGTELVPSYMGQVPANATVVTQQPASYVPLQQGGYSDVMGQTGYQPAIGLLPEWDVLYLTCDDLVTTYRAVVRNAYSAGRFPIHYRDEATNRPLRFSAYPNLSVNASTVNQYPPATTGTVPPVWDVPHHPSLGFMAYLATGAWYFMEQLQFAATRNYLGQVDSLREFSRGIFLSSSGAATVRGAAWAVRTLAQAAVATPDDDALRLEFLNSLAANIDFNYARYVGQANNPFGIVAPYGDAYGSDTDGKVTEAPWQQDFYTAAFGYALAMQPGVGLETLARLSAFFQWKARCAIGRLGGTGADEWLFSDGAIYNFVVALVDFPDWAGGTGPWAANWGALYQATLGVPNPGVVAPLRGGNFPEVTSYWGNLLPAITYAVRFQVTGAAQSLARLTGSSNWAGFAAGFNQSPVWGLRAPSGVAALAFPPAVAPPVVVAPGPSPSTSPSPSPAPSPAPAPPAAAAPPASPAEPAPPAVALPAWARGLALWQWAEIPGTALSSVDPTPRPLGSTGPSSKIEAWCGATLKRRGSVYMLGAAGGHADYAGNEVDALDLLADAPAWRQIGAPSANALIINGTQFYLDSRPSSSHTYYATQFIDRLNRMVVFASPGVNGPFPAAPTGFPLVGDLRSHSFDLAKNDWDGPDYIAQYPGAGDFIASLCVRHPLTGDVYYSRSYGNGWYRWTCTANRWDRLSNVSRAPWYAGAAIDVLRNRMLVVGGYDAQLPLLLNLDGSNAGVSFGGLGAGSLAMSGYPGVIYDEANDVFVVAYNDVTTIKLLTVRASDLVVSSPVVLGAAPAVRPNGIQNSIQYVPELMGFVITSRHDGNVFFMRTA